MAILSFQFNSTENKKSILDLASSWIVSAFVAPAACHRLLGRLFSRRNVAIFLWASTPFCHRWRLQTVVAKMSWINWNCHSTVHRYKSIQPSFQDDELLRILFQEERCSAKMTTRNPKLVRKPARASSILQVNSPHRVCIIQSLNFEVSLGVSHNAQCPWFFNGLGEQLLDFLRKRGWWLRCVLIMALFKELVQLADVETKKPNGMEVPRIIQPPVHGLRYVGRHMTKTSTRKESPRPLLLFDLLDVLSSVFV